MSDYQSAIDWLFIQIPNYQKQGATAYKPGLERIQNLLTHLGNPELKVKSIHIAGTNGKGSVSHIFSSVLQHAGYKVGLFTSPHIFDFRERIKINGELIDESFVLDFIQGNREYFETHEISFFEITTAMAFLAFAENDCDVMVIETGLGGRLDASNVINPALSIITNIGIDHTQFLGNTISAIAREKAGIIKQNTPVVIGQTQSESVEVFEEVAKSKQASIRFADKTPLNHLKTDLLGKFQQRNIHTVLSGVEVLREKNWTISENDFNQGIETVIKTTNFFGRLHLIKHAPDIIVDAAHNVAGIKNLIFEINQMNYSDVHLIYGASDDKEVDEIFKILPKQYKYYFSEFNSKRSVKKEIFDGFAKENKLNYLVFNDLSSAIMQVQKKANTTDLILICGSFYLFEKINEIFFKK
ncbi:bifunctional folylpolyglutamate synthase/dihydrofolate synthase [Crocinitomix catalasitica]|uniref:bifunctional folylpolyglutamate synthase/dihydrofolate synthase n=1 Tax=Crocinitomix catalasitica TaxID=184607 RepID=UPI00047F208E|nr:folylpolyglutamate synthase/dihydrofolate synthase family protein [Crocinitomix catalasitica]